MSEPSNSNPRLSSHTDKNTLTSLNNVSTKKFRRKKIFFSAKNFSLESSNVENKDNGGKGHLGTMLIKLFSWLSVFLANCYNFLLGGSLPVGEHDAYSKGKLLSLRYRGQKIYTCKPVGEKENDTRLFITFMFTIADGANKANGVLVDNSYLLTHQLLFTKIIDR
jgi:hypothetical protein